jgi:hypothetical protein
VRPLGAGPLDLLLQPLDLLSEAVALRAQLVTDPARAYSSPSMETDPGFIRASLSPSRLAFAFASRVRE